MRQCVGHARFAYNWALEEWERQYQAGGKPNEGALRRQLNALKREQFPWLLDVPKSVAQQALKNLGAGYRRFFTALQQGAVCAPKDRQKRKELKAKGVKLAYPPVRKKKFEHDSARLDNGPGTFQCVDKQICLPKIGWVRLREALRFEGRALSATLSRTANRWFIAIAVEVDLPDPQHPSQEVAGADLGIKTAVTLSTGTEHRALQAPKPLNRYLRRMKRLQHAHSRKRQGSSNKRKSAARIAKLHARIANLRAHWTHQTTTSMTREFSLIGIEDLNVRGMLANEKLARAISDVGFYEFRRQLEYKALLTGATVVVADRWFPSSKTCNPCGGYQKDLPLAVREWTCPDCGAHHDRDDNASDNLRDYAIHTRASASDVRSVEDGVHPRERVSRPTKQKEDHRNKTP